MSGVFKTIQRDPTICSNCFRRLYNEEVVNFMVQNDGYPKPVRQSIEDIILPHKDYEEDSIAPVLPAGTCQKPYPGCECGATDAFTVIRPLTKKQTFSFGANLADRIEEIEQIKFDRDQFFDVLEALKTDPDEQHQDDDMYRRAANAAVTYDSHGEQRVGTA
jgi:hypothetical protein